MAFDSLLNLTKDKSFSFWYKIDNSSVNLYSTLLYLKNSSSVYYPTFHLFQAEESGYGAKRYKIHFLFGKNTTNYELPTSELYTDYIDEWVNIIATYSQSSGLMKIYFNGEISDSKNVGNITSNGSITNLQIGRMAPNPDSLYTYFKGDMDDIRIYNRELTQEEVGYIYGLPSTTFMAKNNNTSSVERINKIVKIYPNPSSDKVNIIVEQPSKVSIYDMKGSLIMEQVIDKTNNQIDISSLQIGIYMIHVMEGNQKGFSKFLKQ